MTGPEKEEVLRRLNYDPLRGVFLWREGHRNFGKPAGTISSWGYRYIVVAGKHRLAHRLAWFIVTGEVPENDIDHIDRNRDNNSFSNLREATRSQNLGNSGLKNTNTSGFKGVNFHKARGRWRARITFQYKEIMIGYFDDPKDASDAYNAKAKEMFGEFAAA